MTWIVPRRPKCSQSECTRPAVYRFTWPACQPKPACFAHAAAARVVGSSAGMFVSLEPIVVRSTPGARP